MVIFTDINPFGPVDFQELGLPPLVNFRHGCQGSPERDQNTKRKFSVITPENEAKAPLVSSSTELNRRGA